MKKPKSILIKTCSIDQFFANLKSTMRAADKGKRIKPSYTFIFEDPSEMLLNLKKCEGACCPKSPRRELVGPPYAL